MALKIKPESIEWYESHQYRQHQRTITKTPLLKEALYTSLVSGVVLVLFVLILTAFNSERILDVRILYALGGVMLATLLLTAFRGYFGRQILLHGNVVIVRPIGSKRPKEIHYNNIERCVIRTTEQSDHPMIVMDVIGSDRVLDMIELPSYDEMVVVVEFLEARDVIVANHLKNRS